MNLFSFLFVFILIYLGDCIKLVSSIFVKSENLKTLFCHNNACFNDDNVLFENVEPEKLTIVRTPKDIFENPEKPYKKQNEVTMDQHKTFLENKYLNIENKKKTFERNNKLEKKKILSRTDNKLEKNSFSKAPESLSLTLETTSSKIKEKGEYTSINENVTLNIMENNTQTSSTNKMAPFPTNPPLNTFEVLSYNLTSTENICFCDLTLNHCDINCCCDKDCNPFHWKVFTKCSDLNSHEDLNYCFETIFIFKNNTKVKKKQYNNGLFCVLNENIKSSEIFKTAEKKAITSLTTFKKILPKNFFSFSPKTFHKVNFRPVNYQMDSYIWVFEYGIMKHFGIYKSNLDLSCSYETYVKYMRDQKTICSIKNLEDKKKCKGIRKNEIVNYLKNLAVIARPHQINESENLSFVTTCNNKTCIQLELYICLPLKDCLMFSDIEANFSSIGCSPVPLKIHYEILHNGSEGIKGFKAYIWFEDTPGNSDGNYIQTSEVKFTWVNSSQNIFKRSGNPGYLIGKPLLEGKKINFSPKNDTVEKKSIIELTTDSGNSLTVMGSKNGICLLDKRIPINFQENGYYSCNIKLKTEENFNKEKCVELQNFIFQYLIGKDVANITKDNFFNKFVASFGNSRPEDTEAWVPVLIDLLPFVSSQISFKSGYNYFICSNIVSDLTINVVYSSVGSFQNPQSKILGVSFQLGTYKDILFHCDAPNCESSRNMEKNILLTTAVHFFDLTEPAQPAFAERLSLEIKLPHDFFYPFFSRSSTFHSNNKVILLIFFSALAFKIPFLI